LTVTHALVPLAVLEAIRNLDTPLDDGLHAEFAEDVFAKRLGLSATVAAQIERYREMASRGDRVTEDEALQVFRLAGRRPDAGLVFGDAGRRAARYALRHRGARAGGLLRVLKAAGSHAASARIANHAIRRVLELDVSPERRGAYLKANTIAVRAGFAGIGCQFHTAALGEILRIAEGFEGAIVHEVCRANGGDICRWITVSSDQYW
jgi:hypothetical protein